MKFSDYYTKGRYIIIVFSSRNFLQIKLPIAFMKNKENEIKIKIKYFVYFYEKYLPVRVQCKENLPSSPSHSYSKGQEVSF